MHVNCHFSPKQISRALKIVYKLKLPVYLAANENAWMTDTLFENWFQYHFIPAVKWYCKRKKLDFKFLLIYELGDGACMPF